MDTSFLPQRALLALLLLAAVPLTGCESNFTDAPPPGDFGGPFPGPPPDPGPTATARKFFLSSVGPTLQKSCAPCHAHKASGAPVFLADTPEASYVTLSLFGGLIAFPDDSRLNHYGTHAGPDLTAEQRQVVDTWLKLEMPERGGAPSIPSLEQALPLIGTCMSEMDWTASGLSALSAIDTGGNGVCSDCHSDGKGGAFLSADPKETFHQNRQFPFINRWVRAEFNELFAFKGGWSAANGFVKTANAICDPDPAKNFNCHPPFTLPLGVVNGINKFVDSTITRWPGSACNLP